MALALLLKNLGALAPSQNHAPYRAILIDTVTKTIIKDHLDECTISDPINSHLLDQELLLPQFWRSEMACDFSTLQIKIWL